MTRTLDLAHTAATPAPVAHAPASATTVAAAGDGRDATAAASATTAGATTVTAGAGQRPCREVCARVFEFLDGELPPALAAAVRAHLAACASCRRRVASDGALLAVVARAARAIEGAAPLLLRARIHRALRCAELESGGARQAAPTASPSADRPRRPA